MESSATAMFTPLVGRLLYGLVICVALLWLIRNVLFLRAAQRDARTAHRDLEARLNVLEAEAARRRGT